MHNAGALQTARHLMIDAEYNRAADHVVVWLRSLGCYDDVRDDALDAVAWRLVWHRWRYLTGRLNDGA